jgi:ABC-type methionine transport system permease subunit
MKIDCSEGLAHVRKDLFSIQKWAFMHNIELTVYSAMIRSVMTYACPIWEYATDAHFLKLHRLQSRIIRSIENLDRCVPVRILHVASKFLTCMTM